MIGGEARLRRRNNKSASAHRKIVQSSESAPFYIARLLSELTNVAARAAQSQPNCSNCDRRLRWRVNILISQIYSSDFIYFS